MILQLHYFLFIYTINRIGPKNIQNEICVHRKDQFTPRIIVGYIIGHLINLPNLMTTKKYIYSRHILTYSLCNKYRSKICEHGGHITSGIPPISKKYVPKFTKYSA